MPAGVKTAMLRCLVGGVAVMALSSPSAHGQSVTLGQPEAVPGINKFWRVDATVTTGGSITSREQAIPELKKRGIRTVIDLAGAQEAPERAAVEAAGMKYLVFAINSQTLDPAPVAPFLEAMRDRSIYPVFIHSGNGHRAGALLMVKRVVVDGWTVEKAGIEAASAGLVNDNEMTPTWWKFVQDYLKSHPK